MREKRPCTIHLSFTLKISRACCRELFRCSGAASFNIDSLTVGRTEKPEVSRMTIVVDADEDQARRIVANVYKLVNVLLVDDITHHAAIARDLCLIKVTAAQDVRSQVLELATRVSRASRRYCARFDHPRNHRIRGKSRPAARNAAPLRLMEVVRTGLVAMRRGNKNWKKPPPLLRPMVRRPSLDDSVSYSV